jgi:hypothetical protein
MNDLLACGKTTEDYNGATVLLPANGTPTVSPLLEATRTVSIVFAVVIDPVGERFWTPLGA